MKLLQNKTNVTAPDAVWLYGDINNNTGSGNGTPLDKEFTTDAMNFFERLMSKSSVVANGLPDNETNDWQLYEAFRELTKPYKIYAALLTQTGTNPPTAVVLGPNEIGNIVWTYIGVGQYKGTLVGAFPVAKLALLGSAEKGNNILTTVTSGNGNDVNISTYLSGTLANSFLGDTFIEIRVYDN